MTILHSAMTGSDLHEPKGVETAPEGTVYVSDGAGSGSWEDPLTGIANLNAFDMNGAIDDVSAPNSEYRVVFARDCTLTDIHLVMSGAITGTDSVLSLYRDGVLLGQTISVPVAGSGNNVKITKNLSPTYTFTAGQALTIKSDGASTDTAKVYFTLKLSV